MIEDMEVYYQALIGSMVKNNVNQFLKLQKRVTTPQELVELTEIAMRKLSHADDYLGLFYGLVVINSFFLNTGQNVRLMQKQLREFKDIYLSNINGVMAAIYSFVNGEQDIQSQKYLKQAINQLIKLITHVITSQKVQYIHQFVNQLIIQLGESSMSQHNQYIFNVLLLTQLLKELIRNSDYHEFDAEIYQVSVQINYLFQRLNMNDETQEYIRSLLVQLLNLSYQGYGNSNDFVEICNEHETNNNDYKICIISTEQKQYLNQYAYELLNLYYQNFDTFYETIFVLSSVVQLNQRSTMLVGDEEVEQNSFEYSTLLSSLLVGNVSFLDYCIQSGKFLWFSKALYITNEMFEHQNVNLYTLAPRELRTVRDTLVNVFRTVIGLDSEQIDYVQLIIVYRKMLERLRDAVEEQLNVSQELQQEPYSMQELSSVNNYLKNRFFDQILCQGGRRFFINYIQCAEQNHVYQSLGCSLNELQQLTSIIHNGVEQGVLNEAIQERLRLGQEIGPWHSPCLFGPQLTEDTIELLLDSLLAQATHNIDSYHTLAVAFALQQLTQTYQLGDQHQQQVLHLILMNIPAKFLQQQLALGLLHCNNLSVQFVRSLQDTIMVHNNEMGGALITNELFDLFCSRALALLTPQELGELSCIFLQSYFNVRYVVAMTGNNTYQNAVYTNVQATNRRIVEHLTKLDITTSSDPQFIIINFQQLIYRKYTKLFDNLLISYLTHLGNRDSNVLCNFSTQQLATFLNILQKILPVTIFNNQETSRFLGEDEIYQTCVNEICLEAAIYFLYNVLFNYNYYYEQKFTVGEVDEPLLDVIGDICDQLVQMNQTHYLQNMLSWELVARLIYSNADNTHNLNQISKILAAMGQLSINTKERVEFAVSLTQQVLEQCYNKLQYDQKFLVYISILSQYPNQIQILSISMQLNISLEQNDRYQLIVDIFEKFFQINDQLIQSQPVMLRESLTMEIVRWGSRGPTRRTKKYSDSTRTFTGRWCTLNDFIALAPLAACLRCGARQSAGAPGSTEHNHATDDIPGRRAGGAGGGRAADEGQRRRARPGGEGDSQVPRQGLRAVQGAERDVLPGEPAGGARRRGAVRRELRRAPGAVPELPAHDAAGDLLRGTRARGVAVPLRAAAQPRPDRPVRRHPGGPARDRRQHVRVAGGGGRAAAAGRPAPVRLRGPALRRAALQGLQGAAGRGLRPGRRPAGPALLRRRLPGGERRPGAGVHRAVPPAAVPEALGPQRVRRLRRLGPAGEHGGAARDAGPRLPAAAAPELRRRALRARAPRRRHPARLRPGLARLPPDLPGHPGVHVLRRAVRRQAVLRCPRVRVRRRPGQVREAGAGRCGPGRGGAAQRQLQPVPGPVHAPAGRRRHAGPAADLPAVHPVPEGRQAGQGGAPGQGQGEGQPGPDRQGPVVHTAERGAVRQGAGGPGQHAGQQRRGQDGGAVQHHRDGRRHGGGQLRVLQADDNMRLTDRPPICPGCRSLPPAPARPPCECLFPAVAAPARRPPGGLASGPLPPRRCPRASPSSSASSAPCSPSRRRRPFSSL